MATLANSTSLFEIGFAVNAIFAFIIESYRTNRRALFDFVIGRVSEHHPVTHISRRHMERSIYRSTIAFRLLRYGFWICLLLAVLGVLLSLFWLIENAIHTTASIPDWLLFVYCGLCIILNPLLYFGFHQGATALHEVFRRRFQITEQQALLVAHMSETRAFFDDLLAKLKRERNQ